jgi:flagellar hook-length control protein FliK
LLHGDRQEALLVGLLKQQPRMEAPMPDASLIRSVVSNILQEYSAAAQPEQTIGAVASRNAYQAALTGGAGAHVPYDTATAQTAMASVAEQLQVVSGSHDVPAATLKQADLPALNSHYLIDQLVQRIAAGARQHENSITLQLHPPALGKLQIDLSVVDNQIRAIVIASSSQVKYALEHSIDQLRSALQHHNLEIEKFSVHVEQDANQFASLLRERNGQRSRKTPMAATGIAPNQADEGQGISATIHRMNSRVSADTTRINVFA